MKLASGTWYETLNLPSGVTWIGNGLAIIDGSRGGKSGVVGVNIVGSVLDGLVIRGFPNLGNVQGSQGFGMRNCSLSDGATSGFWMNMSTDAEITGNTITRCGTGKGDDALAFQRCSRILVEGNKISKAAHAGIQFLTADHCRVIHNDIEYCRSSALILKVGFDDGWVEDNFCRHSAWSDESAEGRRDAGIQLVGSRTTIRRCRVLHCGGGIILSLHSDASMATNDNLVELCSIAEAQEAGLDIAGYGDPANESRMTRNRIRSNIAWGSGSADLRVQFRGGSPLWSNTFDGNVAQTAAALEGAPPPHDVLDPQFDPVTLVATAIPDRGYH